MELSSGLLFSLFFIIFNSTFSTISFTLITRLRVSGLLLCWGKMNRNKESFVLEARFKSRFIYGKLLMLLHWVREQCSCAESIVAEMIMSFLGFCLMHVSLFFLMLPNVTIIIEIVLVFKDNILDNYISTSVSFESLSCWDIFIRWAGHFCKITLMFLKTLLLLWTGQSICI